MLKTQGIRQSQKPVPHTASPEETLIFINHCPLLTVRQAVRLRIRVSKM